MDQAWKGEGEGKASHIVFNAMLQNYEHTLSFVFSHDKLSPCVATRYRDDIQLATYRLIGV